MTNLFENGLSPLHAMMLASLCLAIVVVELAYTILAPNESSKKRINRRMSINDDAKKMSQKEILVQLRKERGMDQDGNLLMPIVWLNRMIIRSGVTLGIPKLMACYSAFVIVMSLGILIYTRSIWITACTFPLYSLVLPIMWLKRREKKKTLLFASQLPDAIDLMTRSLRAGHPVPVAIAMVAREMPDPIGTEFGLVSDEVTYGSDLVTAFNSLYERVPLPDLPLMIASISIQSTTGGNLREILEGLSLVLRDRTKMKRKIRAISSEGRISAIFLSAMPVILFFALQLLVPDYYNGIWNVTLTWYCFGFLGFWLTCGNLLIMKMVSFDF